MNLNAASGGGDGGALSTTGALLFSKSTTVHFTLSLGIILSAHSLITGGFVCSSDLFVFAFLSTISFLPTGLVIDTEWRGVTLSGGASRQSVIHSPG